MIKYFYKIGQTPLEEEEKHGLILPLVTQQDLDAFEQENILDARAWVMQRSVL